MKQSNHEEIDSKSIVGESKTQISHFGLFLAYLTVIISICSMIVYVILGSFYLVVFGASIALCVLINFSLNHFTKLNERSVYIYTLIAIIVFPSSFVLLALQTLYG